MLVDIVEVKPLGGKKLFLKFEDGKEGTVDLNEIIDFTGVFEPLKDDAYFRRVAVNPELGTIFWPNEADLCADVLYAKVTGKSIDLVLASKSHQSA